MTLEALERACLIAWPALHRETRFGWELCATTGQSGRVNAVWPIAWTGETTLDHAIAYSADWCARHGVATTFKLTDGLTYPLELPQALREASFAPRTETLIMTAPVTLGPAPRAPVGMHDIANERVWSPMSQTASSADYVERSDIVRRIAAPHVFALTYDDGAPACSGMGVLTGDLLGIYLMRSTTYARRKGYARQVLRALLHWGATHEARTAYLQVEEANEAAASLYASEGFTTLSRYRYWVKH